jgi:hypothetical protein
MALMTRVGIALSLCAWLAGVAGVTPVAPARAQSVPVPGRPPDAIDRSRELSTRPVPRVDAPEPPPERLVPERRVRVPGTDKEVVIPPHYERQITDQQSAAPTLPAYPTDGGPIIHVPGGPRPPAETRPGP